MLDIQFIREHADVVKESQRKRGESVELVDEVLRSDEVRRSSLKEFEAARAQQKEIGKKVAAAPADEKAKLIAATKELSQKVSEYKAAADAAAEEYTTAMWKLSNIVEPEAPEGGEDDYVVVKKVGQIRDFAAEGFEPKDNGDGTYGVQPDGNVAEIGSVKYASLDEALKAAKDRETVKLLKDAELEEVVIRSGRTLDLNGHTLKADYVTYFGGNLVDNSAAHTGLLKVLSADEILFTKNKKIDAMTQIPIYSLEKQGYVFEEIVLRVAPVTNKTPGALQAVYRPRQKDGTSDLSDAQKAMFGSANGHPVTATFRLVYKYKNSNEVQTFEFDFVDTYMDIYLNQNLYMYVTVTGLDIENIETITVTPVLKSAGGQVELVGKTIDTAAVLANLIGQ